MKERDEKKAVFRHIRQASCKTWENGAKGRFLDIEPDGKYRFIPDTFEHWEDTVNNLRWYKDEIREIPIIAMGLIPQYIRWEDEKQVKQIFTDYYGGCFTRWTDNKSDDIRLMVKPDNEIEAAFVRQMIEDEALRIDKSSKLFEYVPEGNRQVLRDVCDEFISFLKSKLDKLEPQQTPEAERQENSVINEKELEQLFIPAFFADDYKSQETAWASEKLSRFKVFLQRLDLLLNDTDKKPTNKDIGGVAFMMYHSRMVKQEYRNLSPTRKRGKFATLLKIVFHSLNKEQPSDTSPNKYKPSERLSELFSDIFALNEKNGINKYGV